MSIFDKQAKDGSINLRVSFQGPQDKSDLEGPGSPAPYPIYGPFGTGRVKDMYLFGDQHRILQVIINLVSNSLKFTPPGGSVNLRIRCLGEALDRANSRKESMQSKYSKESRQSRQRNGRPFSWKHRSRLGSGKNSNDSDTPKRHFDTALSLNASQDTKHPAHLEVDERSPSPSPVNTRTLLFEFEVEDTGPGIPEHLQERVFEPFVQGDLGLSKKYGGTGLGLSICSQLAGLMKGSITLRSQQGVGSTFNMRIPLGYTRERADSTASSSINLQSRRGSIHGDAPSDEPGSPNAVMDDSKSNISVTSAHDNASAVSFDASAKPRLVGLSQPFFTTDPALNSPTEQIAAIERVAAEASKRGDKIRVLVAEDNKVNQEVVLRMLKLEDIYGKLTFTFPRRSPILRQHSVLNAP